MRLLHCPCACTDAAYLVLMFPAQVRDPSIGSVYYYNHVTQESTWDVPHEFAALHRVQLQSSLIGAAFGMQHSADEDGSGDTADCSLQTQEALLSQEQSHLLVHHDASALDGVVHAGALYTVGCWQAFLDHDSQCTYFYNVDTGACEWQAPPEVVDYLAQVHSNALAAPVDGGGGEDDGDGVEEVHRFGNGDVGDVEFGDAEGAVHHHYDPRHDPNYIGMRLSCASTACIVGGVWINVVAGLVVNVSWLWCVDER